MHPFDLLFGAGPALMQIFKMGYYPQESDYKELTPDQYAAYYSRYGHTDEKIFIVIPESSSHNTLSPQSPREITVVTEGDINDLKRGWQIVEDLCSKAKDIHFENNDQKLLYAATMLPLTFTEGTKFEEIKKSKLKIVSMK